MLHKLLRKLSPTQLVVLGFLALILLGGVLLMLPISTRSGEGTSYMESVFLAASAACVTGMTRCDLYTNYTFFGQLVVLLLIQAGGLGVITMASSIVALTRRRIGLQQRLILQESLSAPQMGGIVKLVGFVLRATAILEAAGALILSFRFVPLLGFWQGVWTAIFTSVSAFCNAGFDLNGVFSADSSLTLFYNDPLVLLTVGVLVIIGGIGFLTWHDVREHGFRWRLYRLQTKVILVMTLVLLAVPFLFFLFFEFAKPQWDFLGGGEKVLCAFFTSVVPRTAGFVSLSTDGFSKASLMLIILLMVVGGSPCSTAGGLKTTTFAVMLLSLRSQLKKKTHITLFHRRMQDDVYRNTTALLTMFLGLLMLGTILLCLFDRLTLQQALFTAASALSTVGLDLGTVSRLSAPSMVTLMFLMFWGRVGGMTIMYALSGRPIRIQSEYPQETVVVG